MYVWLVFHPFWLVFISLSQPSHLRSSPSLLHTRVLATSGPVAYCSQGWAVGIFEIATDLMFPVMLQSLMFPVMLPCFLRFCSNW